MKNLKFIYLLVVSVLFSSCGGGDDFVVDGVIDGYGTRNIYAVYYADGAYKNKVITAIDGKFFFQGTSAKPVIVSLFSGEGWLLGRFVACNGDALNCEISLDSKYENKIEGNKITQDLTSFFNDNKELLSSTNWEKRNDVIEKYIVDHTDNLASTVLLTTEYYTLGNENKVDSLLSLINKEARPIYMTESLASQIARGLSTEKGDKLPAMELYTIADTMFKYIADDYARSLLCFTDLGINRGDSIVTIIKRLRNGVKSLKIVDISLAMDSIEWKNNVKKDTFDWMQTWIPGKVMAKSIEKLSIPKLPYFIVADSTGKAIYHGISISDAERVINKNVTSK